MFRVVDQLRARIYIIQHTEPFPIECTAVKGWMASEAIEEVEIDCVGFMVARWDQVQSLTIVVKGPVPARAGATDTLRESNDRHARRRAVG